MSRTVFLLLLLPMSINTLQCLKGNFNITIKFDEFELSNLTEILFDIEPQNNARHCKFILTIDYTNKYFTVEFFEYYHTEFILFPILLAFVTRIQPNVEAMHMNMTSIRSRCMVRCRTEDFCDRRFLLDHIRWFIGLKFESLNDKLIPFLNKDPDVTGIDYLFISY